MPKSIDAVFTRLVPRDLRVLSHFEWTPGVVAVRVASLLAPTESSWILDVGSGVGKLCAIGAMSSAGKWVGIEREMRQVDAARSIASTLGVATSTLFVHADALEIEWRDFDAIYMYRPFAQRPDVDERERLDTIARVEERLDALRFTRVVTLNGFGGVMPASFELVYQERLVGDLELAMWTKRTRLSSVARS